MVRPNLDNVPEFTLPTGFALRWYQPGDEAHWQRIHVRADCYNEIMPELFRKQFGTEGKRELPAVPASEPRRGMNSALHELCRRQCYLLDPKGEVIGTGTAWFDNDFEGARWGRVHWVALVPEYQGQGLSKRLMTALCRRLRELGHDRAYLSTSAARIPAVKLYLQFGFKPMLRTAADEAIWREILAGCRG